MEGAGGADKSCHISKVRHSLLYTSLLPTSSPHFPSPLLSLPPVSAIPTVLCSRCLFNLFSVSLKEYFIFPVELVLFDGCLISPVFGPTLQLKAPVPRLKGVKRETHCFSLAPTTQPCSNNPALLQQPSLAPTTQSCSNNPVLLQQPSLAPTAQPCSNNPALLQQPSLAPTTQACSNNPVLLQQPSLPSHCFSPTSRNKAMLCNSLQKYGDQEFFYSTHTHILTHMYFSYTHILKENPCHFVGLEPRSIVHTPTHPPPYT